MSLASCSETYKKWALSNQLVTYLNESLCKNLCMIFISIPEILNVKNPNICQPKKHLLHIYYL